MCVFVALGINMQCACAVNTLCGQKVELLNVKLAVHIVTTEL